MTRIALVYIATVLVIRGATPSRIDVRSFGAGKGRDDTRSIQKALNYLCSLQNGRELYLSSGTYQTTGTVEIPCGNITISSSGAAWNYDGPGAALTVRGVAVLVRFVNIQMRGNSARGGFGLQILGGTIPGVAEPVGVTKVIVDACQFTGFGNEQGGAAIDIRADSPGITIRDSVFNNPGTAINIDGPTDTLAIRDNYFVSTSGWGVKIANGLGSATVNIEHNNFTTAAGAVRLERAGMVTIRSNEFETYHFVKTSNSAPFEFVSAARIVLEDNIINPHGGSDYCVWVGDAVTDSWFEKNVVVNCGPVAFRSGMGARNSYRSNTVSGSKWPDPASINKVPYSRDLRFDARLGNTLKLILEGDVDQSELVNGASGQRLLIIVCQDESGGREFHWPPGFLGAMTISREPSKCNVQEFLIDSADTVYALGPGIQEL